MTTFRLNGFYNYSALPSGRAELEGEISVSSDGSFNGIVEDLGSRNPQQTLQGFLVDGGVNSFLTFLKMPSHSNLANLAYTLEKDSQISLEGRYTGNWCALPYKIEFHPDYDLFVTRIDSSVVGLSDSAEITLSKL